MQTIVKPAPNLKETVQVLVFKTNLRFKMDIRHIAHVMGSLPGVIKWNVDEHDIDNVLRIETSLWLLPEDVIGIVTKAGYVCEELPD